MPKILIDVTRSPRTGIGKYSWNLLKHLTQTNKSFEFLGLTFPEHQDFAKCNFLRTVIIEHNPKNAYEIKHLSDLINNSADIYIATNFSQISFPRIPIIQVVHDMIYISNPQWQPTIRDLYIRHSKTLLKYVQEVYMPTLRFVLDTNNVNWRIFPNETKVSELFILAQSYSIFRANAIIAVSNTTKLNICNNYNFDRPVSVIYPIIETSNLDSPYTLTNDKIILLYIASFEPRKNHLFLFKALDLLPRHLKHSTLLILIGNRLYDSHYKEFENNYLQYKNRIQIQLHKNIEEKEKISWFKKATALVYPSLEEGFGIPLLEAMIYGLPIVVLNKPFAREVCGNAAMYVNEGSPALFSQAIMNIIEDTFKKQKLIANQKKQIDKLNSIKADAIMNDLLKSVINGFEQNYAYSFLAESRQFDNLFHD